MLGRTISHYRVLAELARGGTGVVYAAEDLRGGHQVALKVFTMDLAGASEALACSHRGAAIVASLHHPNVCAIHEIGEVDGRPFLAMERLEGTTLRELARRKPLSVDRVLELAQEIVAALAAGHRRGIIHRNITPASVFVTHAGQVKLLGFGLAQILEETASAAEAASPSTTTTARSHDGLAQPTVPPDAMAYMSPEQVRGDTLGGPDGPVLVRRGPPRAGEGASGRPGQGDRWRSGRRPASDVGAGSRAHPGRPRGPRAHPRQGDGEGPGPPLSTRSRSPGRPAASSTEPGGR